jgi:hypothetical protein
MEMKGGIWELTNVMAMCLEVLDILGQIVTDGLGQGWLETELLGLERE